ncbi:hypothetical protein VTK56DRAFT_47 [Thermocarpiscus australiensis]
MVQGGPSWLQAGGSLSHVSSVVTNRRVPLAFLHRFLGASSLRTTHLLSPLTITGSVVIETGHKLAERPARLRDILTGIIYKAFPASRLGDSTRGWAFSQIFLASFSCFIVDLPSHPVFELYCQQFLSRNSYRCGLSY